MIGLSRMLPIHEMGGMLIGVFTIMIIEMSNCPEPKRIYLSHEEDASWGTESERLSVVVRILSTIHI